MKAQCKNGMVSGLLCLFAGMFIAPNTDAADTSWTAGTGNWSIGANWDNGEPEENDTAYIHNGGTIEITNAGEKSDRLIIAGGSPSFTGYVNMTAGELTTTNEGVGTSGTGIFTQSNGSHTVSTLLGLGYFSNANGTYNLSGGELSAIREWIGEYGSGTFNHSGGTNTAGELLLGRYSSGIGSYMLSGVSELVAGIIDVGSDGTGMFTQSGGTNTVGIISIGRNTGSSGMYDLSGGELVADSIGIAVLNSDSFYPTSGAFTQSGGTNTTDMLILGGAGVSSQDQFTTATYDLDGGTLSALREVVGNRSVGVRDPDTGELIEAGSTFTQTGGANMVSDKLIIGDFRLSSGAYVLTSGLLSSPNTIVGNEGTGIFNHTGGTNVIENDLILGAEYWLHSGGTYSLSGTGELSARFERIGYKSVGTFTQSGGTNTVANQLSLGGPAGNGTYNLNDGVLWAAIGAIGDASTGSGISIQSGGVSVFNTINVGTFGEGAVELTGGGLSASNERVGALAGSIGTFTQSGGINTVSDTLTIAWLSGSTGNYTLSGGLLDATDIVVNVGGSFSFEGGTLVVDNFTGELINTGGILAPGNSPGTTVITSDYTQLVDGIFEVEIGGFLQGVEYDWLNVGGSAILGGTLDVSLFDFGSGLFEPSLGDSFDILTAETIEGEFDILTLALLGDGLKWDVDYILDDFGTDFVRLTISQVPIPAAVWLFGSGMIGLIGIAIRKKS
jgi:hypothetical protein